MSNRRPLLIALGVLLLIAIVVGVVLATGGDDKASAQTVTFEKPTSTGSDPFTKPADVKGSTTIDIGSGPFGGTGSDLVCDRELLIKSLKARPDRLRAWAEVLGIPPTYEAVARYIRKLKPVTLTRDTRVTNHTFENGRAVPLQSILSAGTAVLVDRYGFPVTRCRCGNPLTKPIYYPKATCYGCPPNYHPPAPCNDYTKCWKAYPDPPPVYTPGKTATNPGTTTSGCGSPSASFNRSEGTTDDSFTLSASCFSPNTTLDVTLNRPDGVTEHYSIKTDSSGSGSYTFTTGPNDVLGTYSATVRDPKTGKSAGASTTLRAGSQQQDQGDQQTTTDETQTETQTTPDDYGGTNTTQDDQGYGTDY